MLQLECVGFGVGVGVRVKWVLPWRRWDVVRCVAGVFFLKVSLKHVDDFMWVCGHVVDV